MLALLLLHGNEALTRDVIIDELWGESPPPTAAKVLQNCVSALRKELPPGEASARLVARMRCSRAGRARPRPLRAAARRRAGGTRAARAHAADHSVGAAALAWRAALRISPTNASPRRRSSASKRCTSVRWRTESRRSSRWANTTVLCQSWKGSSRATAARKAPRAAHAGALPRRPPGEALEAYRAARRTLLAELGIEPGRALRSSSMQSSSRIQRSRSNAAAAAAFAPGSSSAHRASKDETTSSDCLRSRPRRRACGPGPALRRHRRSRDRQDAARRRAREPGEERDLRISGGAAGRRRRARLLAVDAGAPRISRPRAPTNLKPSFASSQPRPRRCAAGDRAAALLVLDDLHAADEGSILLLEFVATELPEMAVLVLALGRPAAARRARASRDANGAACGSIWVGVVWSWSGVGREGRGVVEESVDVPREQGKDVDVILGLVDISA